MFKHYYQLAKPERTYANVFTGVAGFLLACNWHIHWALFIGFVAGLTLVIGSAGVVNNYTDQGLDEAMQRTKQRSLVTGQISGRSAAIYAAILGIIGFALLIHYVSWLVVGLGVLAYIDYVVLYGVSKRRTPYSTWIGTLCGGLSLVAGYVAVTHRLDGEAVLLFSVMLFWQMAHFYAIAIYRAKDYQAAHIPLWPLVYGSASTRRQIKLFIVLFGLACIALSLAGYTGVLFAIIMTLLSLNWLRLSLQRKPKQTIEAWARRVFLFSLVIIMAMPLLLAFNRWLP